MSIHRRPETGRATPAPAGAPLITALSILFSILVPPSPALAGPFGDPGHAIAEMKGWASAVDEVVRGPQDHAQVGSPMASAGAAAYVLGEATGAVGDTLSLGDGGSVTVFVAGSIHNGPNDDFAVFENGFFDLPGLFGEFAFVDVSSNGFDYARFEVAALNPDPVGPFDYVDPSDYFGVAGRHEAFFGTGFDLADLALHPLVQSGDLDLMDVRYVRVVDVVGDGSTLDASGHPIYDPYSTAFPEGGFDLEAVGIIHVPEPSATLGLAFGLLGLLALSLRSARPAAVLRVVLASAALAGPSVALTSTFDDLGLAPGSFENGSGLAGGYTSGGIFYENVYTASFDGFTGFAASTMTDATTPGFGNQFSSITGGGAGGSDGYGLYFLTGNIVLPRVQTVLGAEFTNTTYTALSMLSGDAFAKRFGGATGDDEDYFRLIIEGLDETGSSTGTLELGLADYTFADNALDYILDEWTYLDLSGLGAVKELSFSFESSDVGAFGINTPQYFAIDNLTTIPEPGTALLLALGLGALAHRRTPRR